MNVGEFLSKSQEEQREIENSYGSRKSGSTTDYNFDIEQMIEDFSFYDLIYQTKAEQGENGGFIVITDKQYIIGYNAEHGIGSHQQSYAKCMAILEGDKQVGGYKDSLYYSEKCQNLFLTGRIIYEFVGHNENFQPRYEGKILFILGDKKITPDMMNAFEEFYNDYNREIESVCAKYSMTVGFCYNDENNERHSNYSKSLFNLCEYLKTAVSENVAQASAPDEKIIGVATNKGMSI